MVRVRIMVKVRVKARFRIQKYLGFDPCFTLKFVLYSVTTFRAVYMGNMLAICITKFHIISNFTKKG